MKRLLGFTLALAAVAIFLLASAGMAEAKLFSFQIGGVDHIAETGPDGHVVWTSWKENGQRITIYDHERMKKFVAKSKISGHIKAKAGYNFQPTMATATAPTATARKPITSTGIQQSPPLYGFQAQKNAPKVQSASSPKNFADSNVINKPSSSSHPAASITGAEQGQPASKIAAIAPRSGNTPAVTPVVTMTQKPLAVTTQPVRPEGSRYDSSAVTPSKTQKSVASPPQNFRPGSKYNSAVTPVAKTPASAPQKFAGIHSSKSGARAQTLEEYAAFRPKTRLVKSSEQDFPVDGGTLTVSRKRYIIHDRDLDGNPVIRERQVTRKQWVNRPKGGEVKKYFAWSPGQVLPPDWTQRVGHRMNGIDPATGNIMEFPIPNGAVAHCNNRGDAAGVIGKYTEVPEGAQLLAEMPKKKEKTS